MHQTSQAGLTTLQIMTLVAVIVVIFGAISLYTSAPSDNLDEQTETTTDRASQQTPIEQLAQNIAENKTGATMDAIEERNSELAAELGTNTKVTTEPTTASTRGTFTNYSKDKLALANDGTVVLFFRADWCPSCRGLENDINDNLDQIPDNTHILTLDYDTETELKKQYGVIRQHTLVVVDADGTEVKKLTGLTNTLDQVVNQL